MKNNIY